MKKLENLYYNKNIPYIKILLPERPYLCNYYIFITPELFKIKLCDYIKNCNDFYKYKVFFMMKINEEK
jgi:hypothetical protein